MVESKALEVNLASYRIDVEINPEYLIWRDVMSGYYGLAEKLNIFLKELSHPYKNWQFIVSETRAYALDYFHLIKKHPKGPDTARLIVDIFTEAIESAGDIEVKTDAADNLLLFMQKIIKDSGDRLEQFLPVLNESFKRIQCYKGDDFFLFLKSFYQVKRLAEAFLKASAGVKVDFEEINSLLFKYFKATVGKMSWGK